MPKAQDSRDRGSPENGKKLPSARLTQLSLTAWELEQSRGVDTRGMQLRTQQGLQAEMEQDQGIAREHRSIIRMVKGSQDAVLLIHGSTGSPDDLRGLADHLHREGMSVYVPLLPGHGRGEGVPEHVKWRVCMQEVLLRYRQLSREHRRVHVVGFSFGAALAILLARRESIGSLCLLSPALQPKLPLPMRMLISLRLHKLPLLRRRFGWDLEVLDAMEKARGEVGRLKMPVYAAHCADDPRISSNSLRILQKKIRNRNSRFRLYPEGGHMILAAHGRDSLEQEVRGFLKGGA